MERLRVWLSGRDWHSGSGAGMGVARYRFAIEADADAFVAEFGGRKLDAR